MSDAADIYDALAPYFREYAQKRGFYLSAVDHYIYSQVRDGCESLLDVGSGDGVRGMSIAKALGAKSVVLSDISMEMVKRCRALQCAEVWHSAAEQLPQNRQFDVILCLWNVLGHMSESKARVRALSRMRRILKPGGLLFCDVNNYLNAPVYGWWHVLGRAALEFCKPDERRGDTDFEWKIGDKSVHAVGHLFTPREAEKLFAESGLLVENRIAVNYASGKVSSIPLLGQLLYKLKADSRFKD